MLGAEQVILSLCRGAQELGYQVALALIHDRADRWPALYDAAIDRGIECHMIECRSSTDFHAIGQLRRLLDSQRIDLLHCHGYREDIYAWFCRHRTRIIATNHLWKRTTALLRLYAALDARAMRSFDRVVAVSRDIDAEHERLGIPAALRVYIPNGVATERFDRSVDPAARLRARREAGVSDAELLCVAISSLTEEKGHEFLLRAMTDPRLRQINLRLAVAGDGPLRERLERLVSELSLEHRVVFLGRRSDIEAVLAAADIFVLPSLKEGLPIALLEAMASGTASVATDVGDVREVISSPQFGWLVTPGDAGQLADALHSCATDRDLRARVAAGGAARVEAEFSDRSMTQAYCTEYARILGRQQTECA